jgi:hypothetical protein
MIIWKWPLSQTILDSHYFSSLLDIYDEHYISEDDEEELLVRRKKNTHLKREDKVT